MRKELSYRGLISARARKASTDRPGSASQERSVRMHIEGQERCVGMVQKGVNYGTQGGNAG